MGLGRGRWETQTQNDAVVLGTIEAHLDTMDMAVVLEQIRDSPITWLLWPMTV